MMLYEWSKLFKHNFIKSQIISKFSKLFFFIIIINSKKKMKFAFCGNLDCPEWVLSEIAILNRMSAIKLKLILGQMGKKLTAQVFDQERLTKLCRDQNFD